MEQRRHLFAFVFLLALFGGYHRLLQRNRLLDEHDGCEAAVGCRDKLFGEHHFLLVPDITDDNTAVTGEVRLKPEMSVIIGRRTPFGRNLGIDGRVRNGLAFLVHYAPGERAYKS